MADFLQTGPVTTIQALTGHDPARWETALGEAARSRPVALVLPCLYSELAGPALPRILERLEGVGYLSEIVVTLGVADEAQFRHARQVFSGLPGRVRIVWNDGPRIAAVKERIRRAGFALGEPGKGLAAWMAYGYLLAGERPPAAIALHDTDIVTYERELLDRLVLPVAHPELGYAFAKGYYARVTDRLHGRVCRLFVGPLLEAGSRLVGDHPLLRFLRAFRYPLAGEFAMEARLAREARIPGDWGLEVGTLVEAWRIAGERGACQVDLAIPYDHKHQATGEGGARPAGLVRMAREIALTLLRALAEEGVVLGEGELRALPLAYRHQGREAVRRYAHLAVANGLGFDRRAELGLVDTFAAVLEDAGQGFREDPAGTPPIPSWAEVLASVPDVGPMLREAVEADGAG